MTRVLLSALPTCFALDLFVVVGVVVVILATMIVAAGNDSTKVSTILDFVFLKLFCVF